MVNVLASKPGLTGATVLNIPQDWSANWFRNLINNVLKGGDVRNAAGANGISVTGTIASPYATIALGAPFTVSGSTVTIAGNVVITSPGEYIELPAYGGAGQIEIQTYGAGGAVQTALQYYSDNNLYIDPPATGTPTGGKTIIRRYGLANAALTIAQLGGITISSPAAGSGQSALTVQGVAAANVPALLVSGANSSGSRGLTVQGGTNSSDFSLIVQNAAGSVNCLLVSGDGTVITLGAVTTATTATAGTAALPANPVGFFEVTIGSTVRKVPYYAI